jgi:membrane protein implicated in regulation of membrane protease activity
MDGLLQLSGYHWLVLGLILLGAEVLGAAGFLLGTAIAALVTGVVVFIAPELAAGWQLVLFAVVALIASYLYLGVFRELQNEAPTPELNQRAASLVGHQFELKEAFSHGSGQVQIGDTYWQAETAGDLAPGTRVEVVAAEPMKLQLAPVA